MATTTPKPVTKTDARESIRYARYLLSQATQAINAGNGHLLEHYLNAGAAFASQLYTDIFDSETGRGLRGIVEVED